MYQKIIKDHSHHRNSNMDNITKLELWGGSGGAYWDMDIVDPTTRLVKIRIRHGIAIDSLAFKYDRGGKISSFPFKGGQGGQLTEINLQPGEYLTSINGHSSNYGWISVMIRSLTFTSNMKTYGPYGQETGTPFSLSTPNVEIVGFHGRSGLFLDALGIYVVPVACLSSQDSIRKIGPWGGSCGNNWEMARVDATTRIKRIVIRHGAAIDSIAFQYEQNGMVTLFPSKGGNGGRPTKINLQPDEFLTCIQGNWSAFLGVDGMIRSLTFISNIRRYGPFGEEKGTPFSFSVPNAEIVGFHGSSGTYLNAIGIYVAHNHPILPQENVSILGQSSGFGERKWDNEREDSTPHIKRVVIRHEQVIDPIVLEHNQVASVCLLPSKERRESQPAKCQIKPEGSIPPQDELWITAHTREAAEPNSSEVILTVHQHALQELDQGQGSNYDAEVMRETRELKKMVASLQTQLADMQKAIAQLLQSSIGTSGRQIPEE